MTPVSPQRGCGPSTHGAGALARTRRARLAIAAALLPPALAGACGGWAGAARGRARLGQATIGFLSFGSAPGGALPDPDVGLLQELGEQGYEEGRNLAIERRYADGQPPRLGAMAAELVRLKVDLIRAGGPGPRDAARRATATVRGAEDLDGAFGRARQQRAQGLIAVATNTVVLHRARLAALARADRLLTISEFPPLAQAGFLIVYGADLDHLIRRSVGYLVKILEGERAADLPIEQPVRFRLIVNLATARAIGVTLPRSLLLRADEVIE